jgi:hypothetical protein
MSEMLEQAVIDAISEWVGETTSDHLVAAARAAITTVRCSADSELRKALQAAYLELKKHDADYHYRTPVAVNSMIVDALRAEPQTASVLALEPFIEAMAGVPSGYADGRPFARVPNDARCPGTETTITFGQVRALIAALIRCQAVSASVREALELAEDVLSRAPFSAAIWPNGMHPQRGITKIRDALALTRPVCTCGGDPDKPAAQHDLTCPATLTSKERK